MLKLYHAATSVCSQKVRVGLAEIGLDYDSELLDLQKGDQFDPEYLRLNPEGVVPTLIDGDLVVIESSMVLDYLDRIHNAGRLMPDGRAAETEARYWLFRCVHIHAAINSLSFGTAMRKAVMASKTPEQIQEMLARMPDPVMAMKRGDLFAHGVESVFVGQALHYIRRMLEDMSKALDRHGWVTGPEFGISDIALIAYVDRLERLGFEGLWTERFPKVGDWLAAMQARPSYAKGIAAFAEPEAAARMRAAGAEHWPALKTRWDLLA